MRHGEVWWAALPPPAGRMPVVLLSRNEAYAVRALVIVAPVTTRIRHIPTEVPLGPEDGPHLRGEPGHAHHDCQSQPANAPSKLKPREAPGRARHAAFCPGIGTVKEQGRARQFSRLIPMRLRAKDGCATQRRQAVAMCVGPAHRISRARAAEIFRSRDRRSRAAVLHSARCHLPSGW